MSIFARILLKYMEWMMSHKEVVIISFILMSVLTYFVVSGNVYELVMFLSERL